MTSVVRGDRKWLAEVKTQRLTHSRSLVRLIDEIYVTLVLEALDQPGIDQQTVEASGLGSRCAGIE